MNAEFLREEGIKSLVHRPTRKVPQLTDDGCIYTLTNNRI